MGVNALIVKESTVPSFNLACPAAKSVGVVVSIVALVSMASFVYEGEAGKPVAEVSEEGE